MSKDKLENMLVDFSATVLRKFRIEVLPYSRAAKKLVNGLNKVMLNEIKSIKRLRDGGDIYFDETSYYVGFPRSKIGGSLDKGPGLILNYLYKNQNEVFPSENLKRIGNVQNIESTMWHLRGQINVHSKYFNIERTKEGNSIFYGLEKI